MVPGTLWYILRLLTPFAAPKGQTWKMGPSLRATGIAPLWVSRKTHKQHQLHPYRLLRDAEELVQLIIAGSERGWTEGLPGCCAHSWPRSSVIWGRTSLSSVPGEQLSEGQGWQNEDG